MSKPDPVRVGAPSSAQAVEDVTRECEALKAALARAHTARTVLLVAVIGFVALTVWMFYDLGKKVQGEENLQKLQTLAKQKLADNNDKYMKELQLLFSHTQPVVTQAFFSQAKKDLPSYMKGLERERDVLAENLQKELQTKLDAHLKTIYEKQTVLMEAEYPELKDPQVRERLVNNLAAVTRTLEKKYYVDEMKAQLTVLYDAWDHFPAAEPIIKGSPPAEDQFIAALLDLLKYKLVHAEPGQAK
jgi:hypothetical protein